MSKKYLTISVDLDAGEAEFTPQSLEWLCHISEENALFAADITDDIITQSMEIFHASKERVFKELGFKVETEKLQ